MGVHYAYTLVLYTVGKPMKRRFQKTRVPAFHPLHSLSLLPQNKLNFLIKKQSLTQNAITCLDKTQGFTSFFCKSTYIQELPHCHLHTKSEL